MKVFYCYYYEFDDRIEIERNYSCVAVANTEKEALGFCLENYDDSCGSVWEIEEVDITKAGITDGD